MRNTAILATLVATTGTALAGPDQTPGIDYTISGISGAYVLDFSISASFDDLMRVYLFGVAIDTGRDIAGTPSAAWSTEAITSFNTSSYGGANITYNNIWFDGVFSPDSVSDGETLSGFQVNYTGATAPISVDWFAFAVGGDYTGSDPFFNDASNPGFQGTATIPAPGSLALLGLGGLAAARRRR